MTAIRNCQIILGTGEKISHNLQRINLFIGENSTALINAIAEASCGIHNSSGGVRCVNFEIEHNEKRYIVTSVSTEVGTTSIVKYPNDRNVYNEAAFSEFDSIKKDFSFNSRNFFKNDKICKYESLLSDEEISLRNYKEFIGELERYKEERPIFICGFFEKIKRQDRLAVIDELLKTAPDSQIFIAVRRDVFGKNFSGERIISENFDS